MKINIVNADESTFHFHIFAHNAVSACEGFGCDLHT